MDIDLTKEPGGHEGHMIRVAGAWKDKYEQLEKESKQQKTMIKDLVEVLRFYSRLDLDMENPGLGYPIYIPVNQKARQALKKHKQTEEANCDEKTK